MFEPGLVLVGHAARARNGVYLWRPRRPERVAKAAWSARDHDLVVGFERHRRRARETSAAHHVAGDHGRAARARRRGRGEAFETHSAPPARVSLDGRRWSGGLRSLRRRRRHRRAAKRDVAFRQRSRRSRTGVRRSRLGVRQSRFSLRQSRLRRTAPPASGLGRARIPPCSTGVRHRGRASVEATFEIRAAARSSSTRRSRSARAARSIERGAKRRGGVGGGGGGGGLPSRRARRCAPATAPRRLARQSA